MLVLPIILRHLNIKISHGELQDLRVTTGQIYISDLHLDDQGITIDLDVKGPLRNALQVINHKTLRYATQLGINPPQIQGNALSKLNFSFPLKTILTTDQVKIKVNAVLSNVSITNVLDSDYFPINLSYGSLQILLDNANLQVVGKGHLYQIPIHLTWTEHFTDCEKWRRRLIIKGSTNPFQLNSLGFFGSSYFKSGTIGFNLSYIQFFLNKGILNLTADLTKADINIDELVRPKAF
jgi:hypothetical protein